MDATRGKPSLPKTLMTFGLLGLLVTGGIVIGLVFLSHPQALPFDVGQAKVADTGDTAASMELPVVAVDNTDTSLPVGGNETLAQPIADDLGAESSLPVFSAPCCGPVPGSPPTNTSAENTSSVGAGSAVESAANDTTLPPGTDQRRVLIPDPDSRLTIVLSGLAGCSTCGIEAQHLSRLQDEYGPDTLHVVFVDIYNYGGPDALAWFARVLDAQNLTWAIDEDGAFKETYMVDVDSTLIMDRAGHILYRDDKVTSYEELREQIDRALQS